MRPVLLLLPLLGAVAGYSPAQESLHLQERSAFLLPLPHVLHAGTDDFCHYVFHLLNIPGPLRRLKLTFSDQDGRQLFTAAKDVAADKPASTTDCINVPVPANVTTDDARVAVKLETAAGLEYTEEKRVKLRGPKLPVRLTSRDKFRYRPGDHAHFQLTVVTFDLRPDLGPGHPQTIPETWVTNPLGVRVAQWRDTPLKFGVASFDLHIAEEFVPPSQKLSTTTEDGTLAQWRIHYKAADFYLTEEFEVGEVAPPPVFTVDITAPKSLTFSGYRPRGTVTVGVCARYLFGKPLHGADVAVLPYDDDESKIVHAKTNSTGCAVLDLLLSEFAGLGEVRLTVNVTDPASGESEHRPVVITRRGWSPAGPSLERLATFQTVPANLSRTLVYRAVYSTEDGKPAVNETVEMCASSEYYPPSLAADSHVTIPGHSSPFAEYSYLLPAKELEKLSPEVKRELEAIPLLWRVGGEGYMQSRECRQVITDGEGVARIHLPPPASRVHAVRDSWHLPYDKASFTNPVNLRVMTSPSGSYLALDLARLPAVLPCRGDVKLPLLTTINVQNMPPVQLRALSRGRVMVSEATNSSRPLDLVLHMVPEMSPRVRLLVYSQLPNGEVMADSVTLPVETCFPNEVTVRWDDHQTTPNDEVSLHVAAAPHSKCTVTVKDGGLGLRRSRRNSYELTKEKAMDVIREMDVPTPAAPTDIDEYCQGLQSRLFSILRRAGVASSSLGRLRKGFGYRHPISYRFQWVTEFVTPLHADASDVFRHAGFIGFADAGLHHAPCVKEEVAVWRPQGRIKRHIARRQYREHAEEGDLRFDDRETVVYHHTHTLDGHGTGHVTLTLPGQATSWVASAVCMHPEKGLGISDRVSIKTSKNLFAKMSIPHSVKSGEVLTVPVTIFNNYDSYISVHVKLDNPEYIFHGEGSTPRYAEPEYQLCIAAHRSEVARWSVRFTELGAANVSVSLEPRSGFCHHPNTVQPPRDVIKKQIIVQPDGFQQADVTSHFVCLNSGESRPVAVDLPYPNELVPHSAWLYVSVFGDLLEPSKLGLQHHVRKPAPGAEPNMLDVLRNVYIHEYFTATNLMTSELKIRMENNIAKGLRAALQYQRKDGSFSAHGDQDREGSLWLTVLTIKTFSDAAKFHPDVAARLGELSRSADWVMRQQGSDGCFHPVGELLHQELRGGVEKRAIGALTAYVLLSLHDNIGNYRLAEGLRCIDNVRRQDGSLYSKALVAHTFLQLGLKSRGRQVVKDLLKRTTTEGDSVLYWREDRTVPIYGVRPVADLEMTSYMVLSLIQLSGADNMLTANKAINWIVKQEQTLFQSPQVAATSLQALSAFARRTYSSEVHSTVSVTVGSSKPFYVDVNAQNRLLRQTYKVKDVQLPTKVRFEASDGCVTLQTTLRYASHSKLPHPAFSVSVTATERPSSSAGGTYSLHICVASRPEFGRSDKAIMNIELPSGFLSASASLRDQRYNRKITTFDIFHDAVKVTLIDVAVKPKCFDFRIVRAAEVDQIKPAVINVRDAYEPGREGRLEYTL